MHWKKKGFNHFNHFGNVAGYLTAALLRKKLFLRHFSSTLPLDSVVKIMEQLF